MLEAPTCSRLIGFKACKLLVIFGVTKPVEAQLLARVDSLTRIYIGVAPLASVGRCLSWKPRGYRPGYDPRA